MISNTLENPPAGDETSHDMHSEDLNTIGYESQNRSIEESANIQCQQLKANIAQLFKMWQAQVRLNEPLVRQVRLMEKIINEQAKYITVLESEKHHYTVKGGR